MAQDYQEDQIIHELEIGIKEKSLQKNRTNPPTGGNGSFPWLLSTELPSIYKRKRGWLEDFR